MAFARNPTSNVHTEYTVNMNSILGYCVFICALYTEAMRLINLDTLQSSVKQKVNLGRRVDNRTPVFWIMGPPRFAFERIQNNDKTLFISIDYESA